jgi:hypothetical protein
MYGSTDREDFIGMEGSGNPGVDMLFCWDLNKKLTGIVMNVSCPAQERRPNITFRPYIGER